MSKLSEKKEQVGSYILAVVILTLTDDLDRSRFRKRPSNLRWIFRANCHRDICTVRY